MLALMKLGLRWMVVVGAGCGVFKLQMIATQTVMSEWENAAQVDFQSTVRTWMFQGASQVIQQSMIQAGVLGPAAIASAVVARRFALTA